MTSAFTHICVFVAAALAAGGGPGNGQTQAPRLLRDQMAMRLVSGVLAVALTVGGAAQSRIYVRYADPVSGAAVLLAKAVPGDDAVRLVQEAKDGGTPAGALRTWTRGGGDSPVAFTTPISCTYTDTWSGVTLTTDCTVGLPGVAAWMRPGPREAATPEALMTLMESPAGAHVIGFGPYRSKTHEVIVWAGRGRLLEAEPPRVMTLTATDRRTGASVIADASALKDGDMERYLAAVTSAASFDAVVEFVEPRRIEFQPVLVTP